MILKPDTHLDIYCGLFFGKCFLMIVKPDIQIEKIINFSGNCILTFENDSKAWYTFNMIIKPDIWRNYKLFWKLYLNVWKWF